MSKSQNNKILTHETTLLPNKIEKKGVVYQNRFQKIERVVAKFKGFSKEYFVLNPGQRASIVAVRDDKILLVRQYRLIINDLSFEIPGGRIDENETPEAAALRECREEAGIHCQDLKPLINFYPSLDVSKNYTYIFYSEKVEEISKDISTPQLWTPLNECIKMVSAQQIKDSLSIIAILAYNSIKN